MPVRRLGAVLYLLGLDLHEVISLPTEKNVQGGQRRSPSPQSSAGVRWIG